MEIPFSLKHRLANQSVITGTAPEYPLAGIPDMINELKDWCGAKNDGVAVSYFFRQYALFISSQFELITQDGCYFSGPWQDLQFGRVQKFGYPLLETHADPALYIPIDTDKRFEAFRHVLLEQMEALIQAFRTHVKISPVILWENVLGSVLWFYANLEKRNPRRAAEDLEWLTDARNWQPIRKSYVHSLLGNSTLEQAVTRPLRKTCCLYKELPDFAVCTFCPAVK
ncbi:IucA/IucC family C-terminal-domain containing protein [Indiicoccus explosivorum]|uniref:IucA/IucC family C-terminal-domain containing protein n=1 Tax=Indiicoccus explosivorum TaxID=1917864 RepID=UPI000B454FB7|nr:IucA/IucC family C-terminal-domain containing protein [Indiicoccus explosivorum]